MFQRDWNQVMEVSIVSRWTIGAIASKKASASAPVSARDRFRQRPMAVSGPVATIAGSVGQPVDPLAHQLDVRMRRDRLPSRRPRSRRDPPPAPSPPARDARPRSRRISEPSARISAWSSPTALRSGSSERKLFEQTSSASASVWCAAVALDAAHLGQADPEAAAGELPCRLGACEPAADDVNLVRHDRCAIEGTAGQ